MDLSGDFAHLFTFSALISIITLTGLEIVLGIDNIIFISIASNKLPEEKRDNARITGLILAMFFRIGLLLCIKWILSLNKTFLTLYGIGLTGRDVILFSGGVFLMIKTTIEIRDDLKADGEELHLRELFQKSSMYMVVLQIILIDILLSLDSILTAITIVSNVWIMISAIILSMVIMLAYSGKVADFIRVHRNIKTLAVYFLFLIGALLVLDSFHLNVDAIKPFLYAMVGLALILELLNMSRKKK